MKKIECRLTVFNISSGKKVIVVSNNKRLEGEVVDFTLGSGETPSTVTIKWEDFKEPEVLTFADVKEYEIYVRTNNDRITDFDIDSICELHLLPKNIEGEIVSDKNGNFGIVKKDDLGYAKVPVYFNNSLKLCVSRNNLLFHGFIQ